MKINEAAKHLNTTPRAIRYYEAKGLISPNKDETNDYRTFTETDMMRIGTILALREVGFTIAKIKKLLEDPKMSMTQYLHVQRQALFEQWIEMRDMIETIDQMIGQEKEDETAMEDMQQLAAHLKKLKEIRSSWKDRWNFDSQAETYDEQVQLRGQAFDIHLGYEEALAHTAEKVSLKKGQTCLDIGIGTGNFGARFLDIGATVIGVDQSEMMLQKCKEKHPMIETRQGHFLALPMLDHQVDAIVTSYALHHLPDEEKLLALAEMDRVLKVSGQICITDLMFPNEEERKAALLQYEEAGNQLAIDCIEDEYFANQSLLTAWLTEKGYRVETHQFHTFLGMIYAKRTTSA